MKLSQLLAVRQSILRQAHLAGLAHAYFTLHRLSRRIAGARLRGPVRLQAVNPALERYCPALIALAGAQSVLEEHFSDQDLIELADALALVAGAEIEELEFALEDVPEKFLAPLRTTLKELGIEIDLDNDQSSRLPADRR